MYFLSQTFSTAFASLLYVTFHVYRLAATRKYNSQPTQTTYESYHAVDVSNSFNFIKLNLLLSLDERKIL